MQGCKSRSVRTRKISLLSKLLFGIETAFECIPGVGSETHGVLYYRVILTSDCGCFRIYAPRAGILSFRNGHSGGIQVLILAIICVPHIIICCIVPHKCTVYWSISVPDITYHAEFGTKELVAQWYTDTEMRSMLHCSSRVWIPPSER